MRITKTIKSYQTNLSHNHKLKTITVTIEALLFSRGKPIGKAFAAETIVNTNKINITLYTFSYNYLSQMKNSKLLGLIYQYLLWNL